MPRTVDSVASTHWEGTLKEGGGTTSLDSSKQASFVMGWKAREAHLEGHTNPEELLAAAYATCYSMALTHALTTAGHPPVSIDTKATVSFEVEAGITKILLEVRAEVEGMSRAELTEHVNRTLQGCPVGKALAGVPDKQVVLL